MGGGQSSAGGSCGDRGAAVAPRAGVSGPILRFVALRTAALETCERRRREEHDMWELNPEPNHQTMSIMKRGVTFVPFFGLSERQRVRRVRVSSIIVNFN